MKWKGIVSQWSSMRMTATFAAANSPQVTSTQRLRSVEPISDIPHRFDHVPPELRTKPFHAHVHHVAAGVERVAPDVGEQTLSATDLAVLSHQMLEEEELALAEG